MPHTKIRSMLARRRAAKRSRILEDAIHSLQMEGLELAPIDAADAAQYVAGQITLQEYGRRTRARYGVPTDSDSSEQDPGPDGTGTGLA